jgi:hypothetical protein
MYMNNKQHVNDLCACASGKKYKKCCMNIVKDKHIEIPAQTPCQAEFREYTRNLFQKIEGPHCKICGDTEQLLKILTQNDYILLCDFCYNVQMNM